MQAALLALSYQINLEAYRIQIYDSTLNSKILHLNKLKETDEFSPNAEYFTFISRVDALKPKNLSFPLFFDARGVV